RVFRQRIEVEISLFVRSRVATNSPKVTPTREGHCHIPYGFTGLIHDTTLDAVPGFERHGDLGRLLRRAWFELDTPRGEALRSNDEFVAVRAVEYILQQKPPLRVGRGLPEQVRGLRPIEDFRPGDGLALAVGYHAANRAAVRAFLEDDLKP